MGFPEIVDFAHNFAVMVRVQGPDPKGLKMRRHAFHHYNFGKTTLSASGMLLPSSLFDPAIAKQIIGDTDASLPHYAFVLTVASVIEPFLSNRDDLSQAKNKLITGSEIDIMVEEKTGTGHGTNVLDKDAPRWLFAKLLTLVEIPVASDAGHSLIESSTSALDHGWEVGCSLSSYSNGPQPLLNTLQEYKYRLGQQARKQDTIEQNIENSGDSYGRYTVHSIGTSDNSSKLNSERGVHVSIMN